MFLGASVDRAFQQLSSRSFLLVNYGSLFPCRLWAFRSCLASMLEDREPRMKPHKLSQNAKNLQCLLKFGLIEGNVTVFQ